MLNHTDLEDKKGLTYFFGQNNTKMATVRSKVELKLVFL